MFAGCSAPEPKKVINEKKVWSALEFQQSQWRASAMPPPQIQAPSLAVERSSTEILEAKQTFQSSLTSASQVAAEPETLPVATPKPVTSAEEAVVTFVPTPQEGFSVPPNQCWAQVVIPPRRTESRAVVTLREETVRHELIQSVVEQALQQVVIKDAASSFKVEPPRYKPVTERVLVSEAVPKLVIEPPVS